MYLGFHPPLTAPLFARFIQVSFSMAHSFHFENPGWSILVDMDTMGKKVILSGAHIMQGCRDSWCCSRKGKKASVWERGSGWEMGRGDSQRFTCWALECSSDCRRLPLGISLSTIHLACSGRGSPESSNTRGNPGLCTEAVLYRKLSSKMWQKLKK